MQQYRDIKARYPQAILFFRMGDFYEMFEDDARLAARELGLTLTTRNNGGAAEVPLAGVPVKAAAEYLRRLIGKGHRVAICEQVEDPKLAKGLVRREVVETVTPGSVLADDWVAQKRNNFLVSVEPRGGAPGLAALDLTTGEFVLELVEPQDLSAALARYEPPEVLLPAGTRCPLPEGATVTEREAWEFDAELAREDLLRSFRLASLDGLRGAARGPRRGQRAARRRGGARRRYPGAGPAAGGAGRGARSRAPGGPCGAGPRHATGARRLTGLDSAAPRRTRRARRRGGARAGGAAGAGGRPLRPVAGPGRRAHPRPRGPPAGSAGGWRRHPGRPRPGARRAQGRARRRQAVHRLAAGAGARAHRYPVAQGRIQQGVRLLHRGHEPPQGASPARLRAAPDPYRRRALRHAGAEGVRGEGAGGGGAHCGARDGSDRRIAARRGCRHRPDSRDRRAPRRARRLGRARRSRPPRCVRAPRGE